MCVWPSRRSHGEHLQRQAGDVRPLAGAWDCRGAEWLPSTLPADVAFPLFVKPRGGRGSVGAYRVNDRRELEFFLSYVTDPIVQEYLDGPEFTLDVLCDFDGQPISVVPRERVVIRSGVIDRGRTKQDRR